MLLTLKLEMVEVVQLVPMKTSESGGRWSRGRKMVARLFGALRLLTCCSGQHPLMQKRRKDKTLQTEIS